MALTPQEVYLLIKVHNLTNSFILIAIYSCPYDSFKKLLWDDLLRFSRSFKEPWTICGDFNYLSLASEKFGGHPPNTKCMHVFNNNINQCNLLDFGFSGSRFTWTNKRKNSNFILEHLDRFLTNSDWVNIFSNSKITHLPTIHFDHCPLILDTNPHFYKNSKPFRLEKMWLIHPSFDSLVYSYRPKLNSNYITNINVLTEAIKLWNRNTFGNIFSQKGTILAKLN